MNCTEALDYLVSEVKEWVTQASDLPCIVGYVSVDRVNKSPCYVSMDYHETITKEDWARHRMTLRNNVEHCVNVAVTDQFKVNHITAPVTRNKYQREIAPGVWVDVYDVLKAWAVTNPALQHLIKKALQPGERGHKDLLTDLDDIVASAKRARELEAGE